MQICGTNSPAGGKINAKEGATYLRSFYEFPFSLPIIHPAPYPLLTNRFSLLLPSVLSGLGLKADGPHRQMLPQTVSHRGEKNEGWIHINKTCRGEGGSLGYKYGSSLSN